MRSFYLHTLGCQMNAYDSERVAGALLAQGWREASEPEQADLLLINTCTVRQLAEHKAFSLIGRWAQLKAEQPDRIIGMLGCLAQDMGAEAFRRAPALDFLAGPRALTEVPALAERARCVPRQAELSVRPFGAGTAAAAGSRRVSAYVAVMEGCDQGCTYCAVPQARGREKSRPLEDILAEVKRRIASGSREIVLLAQNITRYGFDLANGEQLASLLARVAETPGLVRLRFLTGHPAAFGDRMPQAWRELPQLCESLHLPLQSGSDAVLRAMRRGYSADYFLRLVERLKAAVPDLALTSDLIVGFPGETDADFQATLEMVERCDFDSAFCFKYSPRRQTPAAAYPGQIPEKVKSARLDELMQRMEIRAKAKKAVWVGRRLPVLFEGADADNGQSMRGRTRQNHLVHVPGSPDLIGREMEVEITAAGHWSLSGQIVSGGGSQ